MLSKLTILFVLLVVLISPHNVFAGGLVTTGAEQYNFYRACETFGGSYCTTFPPQGASGKLVVNQPVGAVSAVVTVIFDGLLPNATYQVWIQNFKNLAGTAWTPNKTWSGGEMVGTFTTDLYGHGDFHLTVFASEFSELGIYAWSVWINCSGYTHFVSDNFNIVID